ncbi:MAG TPA: hypothetical protein VIL09_00245 [Microvirga sp.]|jgi:hypothetical protein
MAKVLGPAGSCAAAGTWDGDESEIAQDPHGLASSSTLKIHIGRTWIDNGSMCLMKLRKT